MKTKISKPQPFAALHDQPKFRGGYAVIANGYYVALFPMTDVKTDEQAKTEAEEYIELNELVEPFVSKFNGPDGE
jgi:hypothetical protein